MPSKILFFLLFLLASVSAYAANPQVEFQTSDGSFVVELYPDKAPQTVANFLQYVNSGFYPGTVFHRTIDRFMIQGGGFTADLKEKLTLPPVVNESNNGLKNEPGTLAMARAFDPNSGTSQFFINLNDNKFLNYYRPDPHYIGYCVFGKVIRGMDVVERIGHTPTHTAGPYTDVPVQPIVIEKVGVLATPIDTAGESKPTKAESDSSTKPAAKGKKRG
ncbi:MAG TPA: peptidylprolyl isomerase [Methylophilaceae bacterium]|nr:peptidylprolyl isomerase [Methylophilaceae bacterium]